MSDSGGRRRTYEWADPAASAAAARELDGISFFREMIAGRIPPPPITATPGFGRVSIEPGMVPPADTRRRTRRARGRARRFARGEQKGRMMYL